MTEEKIKIIECICWYCDYVCCSPIESDCEICVENGAENVPLHKGEKPTDYCSGFSLKKWVRTELTDEEKDEIWDELMEGLKE